MQYIEALTHYDGTQPSIFLAGGISNCPNWQAQLTEMLTATGLVVLNPRRTNFPMDDSAAAGEQIQWEFLHLQKATAILFWFPSETLCPITLYELGRWANSSKPIFIGVDPAYQRRMDVEIQIGLARPDVQIVYSLTKLAEQVRAFSI